MNREILFRGKRVDNGEWVEGYYFRFGWTGQEKSYIVPAFASALYYYEVDPATVGQYTGKVDMHHHKAFEGDVLGRNGYWSLVIEYNRIMPLNTVQYNNSNGISINEFDSAFWEIIGNIHDNPELLEVTQ